MAAIAAAAGAGILAALFMLNNPISGTQADGNQPPGQNSTQPNSDTVTQDGYRKINVTVNGVALVADVAMTGEQRSKGLAVKDQLNETESMLFVFSKANDYGFWMKDMKFPIDIIWLGTERQVIHIEHNLPPCGLNPCPTYKPDGEAKYVLETVAGFAQKHNVDEGTIVEFDPTQLQ